jgi:hypothetical protein
MLASRKRLSAFLLLLLLLPASCVEMRRDRAAEIARDGGLSARYVDTGKFTLLVYERISSRGGPLHVYIEGDGLAWVTPTRISQDPTPTDPVALRLAAADPYADVVYLGRPCQFVSEAAAQGCSAALWSSDRYGRAVIDSIGIAIDRVEKEAGRSSLVLIGYSGGGTVAALAAAQRTDVSRLVTVAANLDTAAWTRLHRLTPLTGSLEPIAFRDQLRLLPQTHFVGARDEIVPAEIVWGYANVLGKGAPVEIVTMPGFTHECCWARDWPTLVATLNGKASPEP